MRVYPAWNVVAGTAGSLALFVLLTSEPADADEPELVATVGQTAEFELGYPLAEVYQVDQKTLSVEFAKKTTLIRIEGRALTDTSITILDVYGNYHQTPIKVVSASTLRAYQWLKQNYANVPGLQIVVDSNTARVRGQIFSQRVREELNQNAASVGFRNDVRFHPYVHQVLNLPPEAEPAPPPPPQKPKTPSETKFQLSEVWTATAYPGGPGGDVEDVPFAGYITRMRDKIDSRWRRVIEASSRNWPRSAVATAKFQITRNGRIAYALMERSSGTRAFDDGILAAIDASGPLESLPGELDGSTLTVHYRFTFRAGGGGGETRD